MPELVIRSVQVDDLNRIAKIERMLFSTPWSEAAFLHEIQKLYSISKAAALEGDVIGYIFANYIMDEGHILNLAVHPEFARQGIATKLVQVVLNKLKEIGCLYVYLEVRDSNHEAKKFYEHLGFKVIGMRKNYYSTPNEDAVLMMYRL